MTNNGEAEARRGEDEVLPVAGEVVGDPQDKGGHKEQQHFWGNQISSSSDEIELNAVLTVCIQAGVKTGSAALFAWGRWSTN